MSYVNAPRDINGMAVILPFMIGESLCHEARQQGLEKSELESSLLPVHERARRAGQGLVRNVLTIHF